MANSSARDETRQSPVQGNGSSCLLPAKEMADPQIVLIAMRHILAGPVAGLHFGDTLSDENIVAKFRSVTNLPAAAAEPLIETAIVADLGASLWACV